MNGGGGRPKGLGAEASGLDPSTLDGAILEGAYQVTRVLGEGGMGIRRVQKWTRLEGCSRLQAPRGP